MSLCERRRSPPIHDSGYAFLKQDTAVYSHSSITAAKAESTLLNQSCHGSLATKTPVPGRTYRTTLVVVALESDHQELGAAPADAGRRGC